MGMHEKQVQVVKVDSVFDLAFDDGHSTGDRQNNNRGKWFGDSCHGQVSEHLNENSHVHYHSHGLMTMIKVAYDTLLFHRSWGPLLTNTHKSDLPMMMRILYATSKEQLCIVTPDFVVVGVDTPEVLLRTMALRHAASFLELYSLVKVDIEKGEVTNMSVDNIDIGDPLVKDLNFITVNLILRSLPLHAYSYRWRIKVQNERNHEKVGMKREERKFKKFLALGWHLEEIHVTWAHLEKKRTRLRTYTKSLEELCK
ncbi:hypothetical protein Tco_1254472 [Tanacetum coccineum]